MVTVLRRKRVRLLTEQLQLLPGFEQDWGPGGGGAGLLGCRESCPELQTGPLPTPGPLAEWKGITISNRGRNRGPMLTGMQTDRRECAVRSAT